VPLPCVLRPVFPAVDSAAVFLSSYIVSLVD
jgi:hypothetical protein